jgi:hypothetical protein
MSSDCESGSPAVELTSVVPFGTTCSLKFAHVTSSTGHGINIAKAAPPASRWLCFAHGRGTLGTAAGGTTASAPASIVRLQAFIVLFNGQ